MPSKDNPEIAPKILILASGGPDSATLAYLSEKERKAGNPPVNAIYLKTGQPSDENEIKAVQLVIERIGGSLEIIDISDAIRALGGGTPMYHAGASILSFGSTIALSIAISYANYINADKVLFGIHKDDSLHGPEYTEEYKKIIQSLTDLTTAKGPRILTPFSNMTKAEVFSLGMKLGVDYSITWSCIEGGEIHCGDCGACLARKDAFICNGIEDPTLYRYKSMPSNAAKPFIREHSLITN